MTARKDTYPLAKSASTGTAKRATAKKPGASKGKAPSKSSKSDPKRPPKSASRAASKPPKNSSKNSPKKSDKSFSKNKAAAKKKPLAPAVAAPPKPKTAAEILRDNKLLGSILASMEDMKAEETVTIDLSDKSSIGEVMVVATGRSNVHLASIADRVVTDLKAQGVTGIGVEGLRQGDWVLIDAGSVIVHLFRPEVRTFYNIEKMWQA